MATVHLTLLQAVVARLGALASVPASRVFTELPTPIDKGDCPAINVLMGATRYESLGSDGTDYDLLRATTTVRVRVHTSGSSVTTQADPVIAQAHQALLADASLGGLAARLQLTGSSPVQAPGDATAGIYELAYDITTAVDERTLQIVTT